MGIWSTEKKRILSIANDVFSLHAKLYPSKIDKYGSQAFERYLLKSATSCLTDALVADINTALEITVKEFDLHEKLVGICALKQYKNYIRDHFSLYENKVFTVYGFLCSWGNLSLVPFDTEHARTQYCKKSKKTFQNDYINYVYETEEIISFECTSLNVVCESLKTNSQKEPIFVKVSGKLSDESFDYYNGFTLKECSCEPYSYERYRMDLEAHLLKLNDEMTIKTVPEEIVAKCDALEENDELWAFLEHLRKNYDITIDQYIALCHKYIK